MYNIAFPLVGFIVTTPIGANFYYSELFLRSAMETDTLTQKTPLLDQSQTDDAKLNQNNAPEVQFYDPDVILGVSKEIALGYLVLLTGGDYKCENDDPQSPNNLPHIDEQTAALAYAAITDGNVLHTCFGLKSGPNGRPTNIIGEKQSTSIFCCFPSASTAALPNLRGNKSKTHMSDLVELLRDVKDLDYGSKSSRIDNKVIHAYVKCFATIAEYHNAACSLKSSEGDSKARTSFCSCPKFLVSLSNMLFPSKKSELDVKLEELQKSSLDIIKKEFDELRLCLAETQTDVVSTAETGVTVDCKEDL